MYMFPFSDVIYYAVVNHCTLFTCKSDSLHILFKVIKCTILHYNHLRFKSMYPAADAFAYILGAIHYHGSIPLIFEFYFYLSACKFLELVKQLSEKVKCCFHRCR